SPRTARIRMEERQYILKLVAKAEGAACLVEAGARKNTRTHRLINQPAIDHDAECRIRRLNVNGPTPIVPSLPSCVERASHLLFPLPSLCQFVGVPPVVTLTENKNNLTNLARADIKMHLKGSTAIGSRLQTPSQIPFQESFRRMGVATVAEKIRP